MAWTERDSQVSAILALVGLTLVGLLVEQGVLMQFVAKRLPTDEVAYWERHVERNDEYAASRIRLALAYQQARRLNEAHEEFEAALAIDPNSEAAAIGRYGVLVEIGQPEPALTDLEIYTRDHSECSVCWQNLATGYLRLGRLDEAEAAVTSLLASRLTNRSGMYSSTDLHYEALVTAGRVYGARGKLEKASEFFRDAISREPRNVRAYLLQAKSLLARREPDAALTILSEAKNLVDSEDLRSRKEIQKLQRSAHQARNRD